MILLVDDDPIFCTPFAACMEKLGHQCHVAENFYDGLNLVKTVGFDVVFLDVILPDANGLEGINNFITAPSSPELIIITGKSESSGAEMALKNGAWDYLEKPPAYEDIKLCLKRALQFRKNKLASDAGNELNTEFIIGQNVKLKQCIDIVSKAAKTSGNVLITGETGTGKDLIAKAVHVNSKSSTAAFVVVDCTNLPDNLVESLLFGHLKGSFTGAHHHREGLVKQADGGTLFLDEVGDLSETAQKSILRVLQNKTYRPLGSKIEFECDFRLISATNRNLRKMVDEGRFRKDLYYRLVTYHVHLPSLRDRPDDIRLLATHYIEKICSQFGINTKDVSGDFIETLLLYSWRGNIRELINVLHASIANAMNESRLNPYHLPVELRIYCRQKKLEQKKRLEQGVQKTLELDQIQFPCLKDFRRINESQYLDSLIKLSRGSSENACRISGVSRSGLYNLLEKHRKKLK